MSHFLKGLSAERFNQKYPVGSSFKYFPIMGIPDSVDVVTRTEAWTLGHGAVVVSVSGRAGGVSIEHLKPAVIADSSLQVLSTEYLKEIINSPANELMLALATELRSLREQLAGLKALPPVGRVIICSGNKTLGWINDAPEGTLLFTAAKPADVQGDK
ncbi:hypothetical protein AB8896_05265 [Yersinia enterocolitica]|uniref:hypothetical protein n=1 Tax=Yersinia enterocolitica TaxID=630 RepID=UPI002AC7CD1C|nr:hypothetical protein [Yersinia enterocolitica]HEN3268156.1 hypothetical protein [Yersinia enterocolitica]